MFSSVRPRALATLAVPALIVALGCAAKPTPVGKWTGNLANLGQATLELKKDGTLTQSSTTPQGPVEATGTYTVDGDKMDLNVTDLKAGGRSVMALVPPQVKAKLHEKVTWKIEGDAMTIIDPAGQSQTLTRVKE